MPKLRDVLRALRFRDRPRRKSRAAVTVPEPGRSGRYATKDTTRDVRSVTMTYNPDTDGEPDPGEVVWTWVPYEDDPTRGKDRPVLIVARERSNTLLGVQLSSQDRNGDPLWIRIGSGGWDASGRESWADLTRVLRVHPQGMRRAGAALARNRFDKVADALRDRYGWTLRS
ncbi:MAG TPA: type II toxin-antitoxin system PemK/MazF family toxin [Jiangellaceae bacterium]